MLSSLYVQNYRGFREGTDLQLRPITILLGRNSSGKSSLTRLIPLIQQSVDRQSSSPILWSSDAVDFGNITDVINHDNSKMPLVIGFRIDQLSMFDFSYRYRPGFVSLDIPSVDIEYQIFLTAQGNRTRFEGFKLRIGDQTLTAHWNELNKLSQVTIDGQVIELGNSYTVSPNSLFPIIQKDISPESLRSRYTRSLFYNGIVEALTPLIHKRVSSEKTDYLARNFPFSPRPYIREVLKSFPNVVQSRASNADMLRDLSNASMINDLPWLLETLEGLISPTFSGSAYIGPARASGNRFDRLQELAVNRISATGDNTAMYLHSLRAAELKDFNELLLAACGQNVRTKESGPGHVSVFIGTGKGHYENLSDVGFGYSQILPVVAQLHAIRNRYPSTETQHIQDVIYAVEQPELHLHPAMQAALADLFVGALKVDGTIISSLTFLIETHSETLVARLGQLIATNKLSSKDVAIYFVNRDEETFESKIELAEYEDTGEIKNWPIGFFSSF